MSIFKKKLDTKEENSYEESINANGNVSSSEATEESLEVENRRKRKIASSTIEKHIGRKIKLFRQALALSQMNVASELGVTFQQFQKYETGKNRIPLAKLMKLSDIFGTNVSVFFENNLNIRFSEPTSNYSKLKENMINTEINKGRDVTITSAKFDGLQSQEEEIVSLVRSFQTIKDVDTRKHISMLIHNLSGENKS